MLPAYQSNPVRVANASWVSAPARETAPPIVFDPPVRCLLASSPWRQSVDAGLAGTVARPLQTFIPENRVRAAKNLELLS